MTETLDFRPEDLDIWIRRGDTASMSVTVSRDGAVYDLAGSTVSMTISGKDNTVLKTLSGVIVDPASGVVAFSFLASDTDLTAGLYSHRIVLSGPIVRTLFAGSFSVS